MHFNSTYKILLAVVTAVVAITLSFSLGRTSARWTSNNKGILLEGLDSTQENTVYRRITGAELIREMDSDLRKYTVKTAQSGDAAIDIAKITVADKTSASYVNPNAMFNLIESEETVLAIQESETPGSLLAMSMEDIEIAYEDLKELQLKYAETEASYQALVARSESNETSLRTQLDQIDAEITTLQGALEALSAHNANIAQLEAKEAERDLLRAQLMELESNVASTTQEKNTLIEQNNTLTSEINVLKAEVSAADSTIASLNLTITELTNQLNSLTTQLDQLNAKIAELTNKINNMSVGLYKTSIAEVTLATKSFNMMGSDYFNKQNGAQYGRFVTTNGVKKFTAYNPDRITAETDGSGNTFWKCYNIPYIANLDSTSIKINNYQYSYSYYMQQFAQYYLGSSPQVVLINTTGNTSNTQMWLKWSVNSISGVPYGYMGGLIISKCDIMITYRK